MTDVGPFAQLLLLLSLAAVVAVLSNRLTARLRVPAPALFLAAAARAAAARNSAGAGTRSRAVSRLESTATTAASDRRSSSWAKGPTSVMDLLGRGSGHLVADQTSRRTTVSLSAQDPGPGSNWSAGAGSDGNKKMKGIGRAAHPIPFTCEVSCSWLPLAGTGSEAALDQGHDAR